MTQIVTGQPVVDWVARKTNEFGNFGCAQGIGLERDGQLIAGVAYAEFNGVNVVAHIASDGSRQWMTRQYLWTIFDYPFNQLKVNRITILIGEGNAASWNLAYHLGFYLEANLRGAHPTGEMLVFCMFKESCRWLALASKKQYAMAA